MWCPSNDYVLRIIMERRTKQFIREAEIERLLHGICPPRPGVLSRSVRSLLHHLGHLLVAIGGRLERLEASPAALRPERSRLDGAGIGK
jgi:hypothetical protein